MGAKKFSKDWWKEDDKKTQSYFKKSKIGFHQMRVTSLDEIPQLVSTKEAAEKLNIHYKTVETLRNEKKLRFEKKGGRYYTTPEWISDYLEQEMYRNK